ncbi:MAG TPA: hypothetical protein VG322_09395 [Candidatus Acidoferrales bacterium]|jgi:hypothetical protein|nr:hypothetical protein [Candidatus Acidoferrales bacterium]
MIGAEEKVIYWHRELPPLDAEPIGERIIEINSMHVPGTLAHRDELWEQCYADLMAKAATELNHEILRMGAHYAHILSESVDSKRNDVVNEAWLHASFTYVVYRRGPKPA